MPSSAPASSGGGSTDEEAIDVACHQQGLLETRRDIRVEPPGLEVGGDRLFVQAAIPAGVNQTDEELGIVAVTIRLGQQSNDGARRLSDVGLEIGVELVSHGQVRAQRQRAFQGVFGARSRCRE